MNLSIWTYYRIVGVAIFACSLFAGEPMAAAIVCLGVLAVPELLKDQF